MVKRIPISGGGHLKDIVMVGTRNPEVRLGAGVGIVERGAVPEGDGMVVHGVNGEDGGKRSVEVRDFGEVVELVPREEFDGN
jgi:hypothetical protein